MQSDRLTFFHLGAPVGQFEDGVEPGIPGTFRYMPFRGQGHLAVVEALRRGETPRCTYRRGAAIVDFTVSSAPEYGVLDLAAFEIRPDDRTQKARMLAGELYLANDPELHRDYARAQRILARFNAVPGDDIEGLTGLLRELLGELGADAIIKPSFRCDYGSHISVGARSFMNYDCVLLDCNTITLGEEVQAGPGVHLYTATHPLEAPTRRAGFESAKPIVIGDGVWLGGRSVVCPGVTIGENTVVGAGSVVTKDLPANVLAVGAPCRVVRDLNAEDRSGS